MPAASKAFNGLTCMVYGKECDPSSLRREGTLTFARLHKAALQQTLAAKFI